MEPAGFIKLRDLYKSFGNKPVLEGANLRLERGETMVILGGSGYGCHRQAKLAVFLRRGFGGKQAAG